MIKARGVFGGSMLGAIFFHASIKAPSVGAFASKSVEKRRAVIDDRERMRVAALRNMVTVGLARVGVEGEMCGVLCFLTLRFNSILLHTVKIK